MSTTTLRDRVELHRGQSYKSALLDEPGPYLLGLGTIARNGGFNGASLRTYGGDSPDRILLHPGDLYLSLKDVTHKAELLGAVSRVPSTVALGRLTQDTVRLQIVDENLNPDFLYWLLQSPHYRAYCRMRGTGTTNLDLSRNDFLAFEFILPPVPEQQAIAEVLGALDDKIAANTRLAATADEMITVLYREALHTAHRDVALLAEFKVDFGEPFGGEHFSEPGTGRPLIRIRDLKTFSSKVWTTETRPREVIVSAGDVVIGMDAEFRATRWAGEPGLLNQRVCRFSHPTLGNALVREALDRPLAEVENEKSATTVIHLNKGDLARKTARMPLDAALEAFELRAEPAYAAATNLSFENRTLAATRDALLPKLMSGQLRVQDAVKIAEKAGV